MAGMSRLPVILCGLVLLVGGALAQDELANVKFLVVKDYNGKPIRNASVVLHPVNKKGKQERGGLQLKADAEGKASYDGVPYGKLRVQVLAPGFQTFGQDYDIDQPVEEISVRLKRPSEQYSIYRDNQNDPKEAPAKPAEQESKDKPK
jgi:hypothetical protein